MFESINELMSEYSDKVATIEDIMIQQERTIEYAAIQEDLDLLFASRDVVAMLEACDNKIPNEAAAKYLVGFMQAHNLLEAGEVTTRMVIESVGETLGKFWDKIGEILQKIWDFFFGKSAKESGGTAEEKTKKKKEKAAKQKNALYSIANNPKALKLALGVKGKTSQQTDPVTVNPKAANANVTI